MAAHPRLAGNTRPPPPLHEARRAKPLLGTLVDIHVHCASESMARSAITAAFSKIADIHARMSYHLAGSDLDRLNRARPGESIEVDPSTAEVLACAEALRRDSGGAFDVAVADALVARRLLPHWATPLAGSFVRMPAESGPGVWVRRGRGRIDLGGIAKGYAVDAAVEVLRRAGVASGLVNAGGDLRGFGDQSCAVHVRDPVDPGRTALRLDIDDMALGSSATRALNGPGREAVSALVDPRCGQSLAPGAGASVLAPTCMLADALTKLVLVTGNPIHPLLARHGARTVFFRAGTRT